MGMDWPLRPAHHHEHIDRRCTRSQYGTSSSDAGLSARCTVVNERMRPRPLASRDRTTDKLCRPHTDNAGETEARIDVQRVGLLLFRKR